MEVLGRRMQSNKTNKLLRIFGFNGPEPPTTFSDKSLASNCHCIAFSATERLRIELHDLWVSIERGERFTVGGTPLTQPKALCVELN